MTDIWGILGHFGALYDEPAMPEMSQNAVTHGKPLYAQVQFSDILSATLLAWLISMPLLSGELELPFLPSAILHG